MNKKKGIIIGVLILALVMVVGYALFSDTLTINGTATAEGAFDMQITKATVINEVGSTGTSAVISDNNTLDILVPKLEYPGAYSEIEVTVENKGSITSVLKDIIITKNKITKSEENVYNSSKDNIRKVADWTPETTQNGSPEINIIYSGINKGMILEQGDKVTFVIKVEWNESYNVNNLEVDFTLSLKYEQITA